MRPITCPICTKRNPPGDLRCISCGADFTDPDVMAMAATESSTQAPTSLGEVGQLSSDKFFGISRAKLLDGGALRTVALFGGIALLIAFIVPIPKDPVRGKWWMSWSVGKPMAGWAFWFPLLFGSVGIALAFAPKPDRWIRAIILAAMSVFGLLFIMPRLGRAGGGFNTMMPLFTVGLTGAACAMALRVYFPLEQPPRLIIIVAAAITIVGLVLPMANAGSVLPIEFRRFSNELKDVSLLGVAWESTDRDMMIRMLGLYTLFAMVLLIGASAAAWPVPGGVWDKTSFFVRPVAWAVVLYLPFQKLLLVFNIAGWSETGHGFAVAKASSKFSTAIMIGRTRMVLVAAVFIMWTAFSAVVIYKHFRPIAGAAVGSRD